MSGMREFRADELTVRVYPDRPALGVAAANEAASALANVIATKRNASVLFAAAPSQNEFLSALATMPEIDWSKVTAFQLDEYIGLPDNAPESFGAFLQEHIFDAVRPGRLELIGATGSVSNAEARCTEYTELLALNPPDIVFLGIGENGHLAFNDPPVADFDDPLPVKVVELDRPCREQQVNDGCFPTLGDVPTHAITLTIPTLLAGGRLFCIVPGPAKRAAVAATLHGPISTDCPASILRTAANCTLYLDADSYADG
jgi:glucosamine-6-phosphate deaminase